MATEKYSLDEWLHKELRKKILTRKEEQELRKRIQKGDQEARETLALHNIKLVVWIARKFLPISINQSVNDLISIGFAGLMRAVDCFNKDGIKFSTYATTVIRRHIQTELMKTDRMVRIPINKFEDYWKLCQKERSGKLSKSETAELAELTKIISRRAGNISIQNHKGEEDRDWREGRCVNPVVKTSASETLQRIDRTIEVLGRLVDEDRDVRVFGYYFGLWGMPQLVYEKIGKKEGVTRERIRQLIDDGLIRFCFLARIPPLNREQMIAALEARAQIHTKDRSTP